MCIRDSLFTASFVLSITSHVSLPRRAPSIAALSVGANGRSSPTRNEMCNSCKRTQTTFQLPRSPTP
eukprot:1617319-Amphidinium_carterae.1